MIILYFGDTNVNSTSYHRAGALARLGHDVRVYNPTSAFRGLHSNKWAARFHYRTGFRLADSLLLSWLDWVLRDLNCKPDICWINSGEHFSERFVATLRKIGCPVILYNNDDPTGSRDGGLWTTLLRAIPLYDLCVALRPSTEKELRDRGARKTLRVWMSYDEIAHRPLATEDSIASEFTSEVIFVGTWIKNENRHLFLRRLVDSGLQVKIWGSRWERAPDRPLLAQCLKGGALYGRDYVKAIAGAKVCLGLLSLGNRDQHTQRSVEIPFCGGLLCAQRTDEHQHLYEDGVQAMFWSDTEECVSRCFELINNHDLRNRIRNAGFRRVRELKVGNEEICQQIIGSIFSC